MAALPESYLSPEVYLERERQAEEKSEFIAGEIIAMAGASRAHTLISTNLVRELSTTLRGRPCETYASEMRVMVSETGAYVYPDIVVVCGEPLWGDVRFDTLLNPTFVLEILSPSTESYDLGLKLAHYRQLESMQEFVAAAQDRVYVQHWMRRPKGLWLVEDIADIDATIHLESIGCDLALADVYDRVDLAAHGGTDGRSGTTQDAG